MKIFSEGCYLAGFLRADLDGRLIKNAAQVLKAGGLKTRLALLSENPAELAFGREPSFDNTPQDGYLFDSTGFSMLIRVDKAITPCGDLLYVGNADRVVDVDNVEVRGSLVFAEVDDQATIEGAEGQIQVDKDIHALPGPAGHLVFDGSLFLRRRELDDVHMPG